MRHAIRIFTVAAIVSLGLSSSRAGLMFTNLTSLVASNGAYPVAGLIQATDGNFYGTAYEGGGSGNPGFGTVFRVSPGGAFSNLFSFNSTNGAKPYAGLVQYTNGNFYGTTEQGGTNGGYGTVFEMTPTGVLTTLLSFNNADGAYPEGALVLAADGNFYGTTSAGGTNGGFGTLFAISPAGNFDSLLSFNNADGANPYGALVPVADGNFYGTTEQGGTNGGYGTVFKMTSAGALTTLYSFDYTNGANPYAALTPGAGGNFYGTASSGGASNNGTIFLVTPAGALTTLFAFNGANGASPFGSLIQAVDGSFYGTTEAGGTNSYGTVFKWSPGDGLVPLVSFDYLSNGAFPLAGLTQGTDGNFYGTAHGGTASGKGAIFRISAPVAPVFKTARVSAGSMALSWTSVAGQTYQLQGTSNLSQANWNNLGTNLPATNGIMSASDSVPPPPSRRFYRVLLLP
jgi:uncharacterized repeat protein (TIGR03803 family)